tara:strand:+ start:511 stop:1110 length:600 start_codon:yes stop_codon:yes gene_type:complete
VPRHIFLRVLEKAEKHQYFRQKRDACGKLGISALAKCTAAFRILALGVSADAVDEYCRVSEDTALQSLKLLTKLIVDEFGGEYLREPRKDDVDRILEENERRGFPGLFGSLDCTHWTWKNCPTGWAGQYTGKEVIVPTCVLTSYYLVNELRSQGCPTVVLEGIADSFTWIWHAYFGLPGSCNDINVLDNSPLLLKLING